MENIKQSLKVCEALTTIAEFLEITEQAVATRVSLFDKDTYEKIRQAMNQVSAFYEKPFAERAKSMGYQVVEHSNGSVEVSTEL